MSVAAAALGVSSFGSATISISISGGNSARMPFAVSAATLPRNSALMDPPSRPRSTLRDDMQQFFAADKAVDVARRIGAAAPRESDAQHDDIAERQHPVELGERKHLRDALRRLADRAVGADDMTPERGRANGGLSPDLAEPDNSDRQPAELAMQRPVHDAAVAP